MSAIKYVGRRINPSYLALVINAHSKTVVDYNVPQSLSEDAIIIYNNVRPHLSNQMLTTIQMHALNKLKRKQYKSKKLNNHMIVQL